MIIIYKGKEYTILERDGVSLHPAGLIVSADSGSGSFCFGKSLDCLIEGATVKKDKL